MYVVGSHVVDGTLDVVMVTVNSVVDPGEDVLLVVSVMIADGGGVLGAFVVVLLSIFFMARLVQGSSGSEHSTCPFSNSNL